ncbi:hypothetical protein GOV04_02585 [Candidatus Woesearchaeota archaeon]|nr:hypothetical protein [Candidatus Woesearchaeota archaeon]
MKKILIGLIILSLFLVGCSPEYSVYEQQLEKDKILLEQMREEQKQKELQQDMIDDMRRDAKYNDMMRDAMYDDMRRDMYKCEYEAEYDYITDKVEMVLNCPTLPPDDEDLIDIEPKKYRVTKVIDGDTIELETGERVRLIGINSAEFGEECFEEAKEELEDLILGKEVTLEVDIEDKDKYGRLLRYIYVEIDGEDRFVNYGMIILGLAYSYSFGNTYDDLFDEAEELAKGTNNGCLWENVEDDDILCFSNYYNCEDFDTELEAQAVYYHCKQEVGLDIHHLDGDDDGKACEALP